MARKPETKRVTLELCTLHIGDATQVEVTNNGPETIYLGPRFGYPMKIVITGETVKVPADHLAWTLTGRADIFPSPKVVSSGP